MSTPVAAQIDSVFARTDTTAATAPDRIGGLMDATYNETADLADTNYLGTSAGYKSRLLTLKDSSLDLSGHFMSGDAPQGVLRTAKDAGSVVYITIQFDANASAGSIGKRVPMLVSSYEEKLNASNIVEFTAKLVGNGAPTAI